MFRFIVVASTNPRKLQVGATPLLRRSSMQVSLVASRMPLRLNAAALTDQDALILPLLSDAVPTFRTLVDSGSEDQFMDIQFAEQHRLPQKHYNNRFGFDSSTVRATASSPNT